MKEEVVQKFLRLIILLHLFC